MMTFLNLCLKPRAATLHVLLFLGCLLLPLMQYGLSAEERSVASQCLEDFEAPEICLRLHAPDSSRYQLHSHVRTNQTSAAGKASELIRYTTSHGTNFYAEYPIEPMHLISEFAPQVRVKSTRSGIKILARVVLPRTPDPTREGPMTALISGPMYDQVGRWQRLSFSDLPFNARELLYQQCVILGRKYQTPIDPRGAYVDSIFLDLYTAPGETSTWVDDLQIRGGIPMDSVLVKADHTELLDEANTVKQVAAEAEIEETDVQISARQIKIASRPFHLRMIRHRGESFERIREMGFNTIWLSSTAHQHQLDQAAELGLWLVCPPPPEFHIAVEPQKYARVLAWMIGSELVDRDLEITRQKAATLRQTDPLDRLIVCQANTSLQKYARFCDALMVNLPQIGQLSHEQQRRWIVQRRQLSGANIPLWPVVPTAYSQRLEEQIAAFDGSSSLLPVEHLQLRNLLWHILPATDGIVFDSRGSLDATDPTSIFRSKTLTWLNGQLLQLEPWLAAGLRETDLKIDSADVDALVLRATDSRLILLAQKDTTVNEQNKLIAKFVTITEPAASASSRVFLIDENGTTPVVSQRDQFGLHIRVDQFYDTAAIVITDNAATINFLSNSESQNSSLTLFGQHHQLTASYLGLVNKTLGELNQLGVRLNDAYKELESVMANLAQAEKLQKANNRAGATASLQRADRFLRAAWQPPLGKIQLQFNSLSSSPLAQHFTTLPAHYRYAQRMSQGNWGANRLPAGDFENLGRLTQSGWKQIQQPVAGVESVTILSDQAKIAGESAMHLRVWRNSQSPAEKTGLLESAPAWVSSAPVRVQAGEFIRVHGWIKVTHPITDSLDGFMLIDSIGGPELATRYTAASDWQQFAIYRVAEESGPFQVTFLMTGIGEVILDEITIRTFEPATVPGKTSATQ